jgi:hypothetical protein
MVAAIAAGRPINQFAMMGVNRPTAYFLLTDIVKLQRGSWVIQNGANSGVGRATITIAKSLGLRTVNIVRRDEVVAEIKALGGDVVLVDGPDLVRQVAVETEKAPIKLALDGVADAPPTLSGDQPAGRHPSSVARRCGRSSRYRSVCQGWRSGHHNGHSVSWPQIPCDGHPSS